MLPLLVVASVLAANTPPPPSDVLLDALTAELTRSKKGLPGEKDAPMYYLSYRVTDGETWSQSASFGALEGLTASRGRGAGRVRLLDVTVRMGSPALDNSHKQRGGYGYGGFDFGGGRSLPIDDDRGALEVTLWKATDEAYRSASRELLKVRANVAVKTKDEDSAPDFSKDTAHQRVEPRARALDEVLNRDQLQGMLKRLSVQFKTHPNILRSGVAMQVASTTHYFVDSDGAKLREPRFFARLMVYGSVRAEDGMELDFFDSAEATTVEGLPSEADFSPRVARVIERLEALRKAPTIEPYTGPATIRAFIAHLPSSEAGARSAAVHARWPCAPLRCR